MKEKEYEGINSSWNTYDSASLIYKGLNKKSLLQQQKFNSSVVRILNDIRSQIQHDSQSKLKTKKLVHDNKEDINAINRKLDKIKNKVDSLFNILDINTIMTQKSELLKKIVRIRYHPYEDKYSAPEVLVKLKLKDYVNNFVNCQNVLDIGCGRGEFLELLKSKSIKAVGIEQNESMVELCHKKKLKNVFLSDYFSFLVKQKDGSFDGAFCSQYIQFLLFSDIELLFYLLSKKLRKGSILIVETLNPLCKRFSEMFYINPHHTNPIYPAAFEKIAEVYGFRIKEVLFKSPLTDSIPDNTTDERKADKYKDFVIYMSKL